MKWESAEAVGPCYEFEVPRNDRTVPSLVSKSPMDGSAHQATSSFTADSKTCIAVVTAVRDGKVSFLVSRARQVPRAAVTASSKTVLYTAESNDRLAGSSRSGLARLGLEHEVYSTAAIGPDSPCCQSACSIMQRLDSEERSTAVERSHTGSWSAQCSS